MAEKFPEKLSLKASRLHRSIRESFNEEDRVAFTDVLSIYHQNKNIQRLVESLRTLCATQQQREEIYPLVRNFIPSKHRARFDYECVRPKSVQSQRYSTYSNRHRTKQHNYGHSTTRSLPIDYQNVIQKTNGMPQRRSPQRKPPKPQADTKKDLHARVVVLEQDDENENFGFSVRGGIEYNIGLYVSSVEIGSVAHNAGISIGDQILEVNNVDFRQISHQEAIEVIRNSSILHMLVKSEGKIPSTFQSSECYRWVDISGNEVSPPPKHAAIVNGDKSEMRLLGADDERKVNLFVADGAEIGLTIRGGVEHGLGIFVASVEHHSGADRAGIQVGDQILDVNGKSFVNISHEEAVSVMKSSQQLVIMLKDVGILPHGKRVYDETKWRRESTENIEISRPSSSNSSEIKSHGMKKTPSFHEPIGSSQLTHHSVVDHCNEMLKMTARQLLSNDEQNALTFYLQEYRSTRLSLKSFLAVLYDVINSPKKTSLYPVIRSSILPRDIRKFDEWTETFESLKMKTINDSDSRNDRSSLYSYKSTDSSQTMDSWLGLFEDGKLHTNTDFKYSVQHNTFPQPPKEFLEDKDMKNNIVFDPPPHQTFDTIDKVIGKKDSQTLFGNKGSNRTAAKDFQCSLPETSSHRYNTESTNHHKENTISLACSINSHTPKSTFVEEKVNNDADEQYTIPSPKPDRSYVEKSANIIDDMVAKGQNKGTSNLKQSRKLKPVKNSTSTFTDKTEKKHNCGQPFVVELMKHSNNLGLSVKGGMDTVNKEIRIKSIKDEETVAGSCPLLKPGQIILGVDDKSLQNVTSGIAAMSIRQAFHSDRNILKLILLDDT